MSSSSSDESSNSGEQVDMEALLEEMGEEGDDNGAAVFAEDADSSDSSDDEHNHEMEDGRMRRLLRASSSGTLDSESNSSSSSGDGEEGQELVSESSEEETGPDEDENDNDDDKEEEVKKEDYDEQDEELSVEPAAQEAEEDEGSVIDEDDIEDTLERKPRDKKETPELPKLTETIDENDPEAAEMKKLLGEWGVDEDKNNNDDSDSDDGSDDEDERIVILDPNVLDHIVLAAPDLDEAIAEFEQMTGTKPIVAGTINGLGIRCARVSFNDSSYLEIIAPDHKKIGPIGTLLKTKDVKHLTPFAFAVRTNRAEELKKEVEKFAYIPDHITMFGGSKEGEPMKWELLFLYGHKLGGMCPYFVDWNNSQHPCAKLPIVGKLKKFTIRAPANDPVHQLLAHVDAKGFTVEEGKSKFSFQFSSPEGTVKFAASKAIGFKFPGFADENVTDENLAADVDNEGDVEFADFEAPELLDTGNGGIEEALPPPCY